MERTLYGISSSTWTERARWALDHHRVTYRYKEHLPFLGELALRRKASSKKPTVPLLEDDVVVMGSAEIGRHADRIGKGEPLFATESQDAIDRACTLADRMANAARACVLSRIMESRDARIEALPSFIPGPLRPLFASTTGVAIGFLAKKHGVPKDIERVVSEDLRPALAEVRSWLGGRRYLTDRFSYADIAIGAQLGGIRPHTDAPIGPAMRDVWTNEALAEEFSDLLVWRDALYADHRRRTS
jgi:glutathione S-transferase